MHAVRAHGGSGGIAGSGDAKIVQVCKFLGFCSGAAEMPVLLGYYAMYLGNLLPTF